MFNLEVFVVNHKAMRKTYIEGQLIAPEAETGFTEQVLTLKDKRASLN